MTTLSPADLDGRGRLTISDRTVERIAATAVTEVEGVGGSATRMLGVAVGSEGLDNAAEVTAKVSGDNAVLDARLSVSYPASVSRTTEAARSHVIQRVEEFTGLTVSRMDITVTALHSGETESRRVQ
ncbi:MAG: Asp23/Gls24 family envelope stress response protein [Actinomycetota bacterium]|nr:Asp23/Gls24 family envelope stress response protein [Actinomycetota bacterium]